ncbi:MAG: acyl carrier protein [Rhodocyclaceae bacterium]|nr:acyl carrier protein [Rhodocyclaceae bacterium]
MTARETYTNIFIESFGVEAGALNESFVYQCVPSWDSVGHMSMIAALEDAFDIALEVDDIVDFSSFTKGIEILAKYGVTV